MAIDADASISDSTEVKPVSEVMVDANNDGELDLLGQYVTVSGQATVASSVFSDQNLMVYLQDSKAGLIVYSDTLKHDVARGDSLIVAGRLQMYYGKPEIVVDSLRIVQTGLRRPSPIPLRKAFENPHRYLGMFVEGEAIVTSSDFTELTISPSDTSQTSLTVYVRDGHRYREDFDFDMLRVGDRIKIRGVMDLYKSQATGETIYEILPRSPDDVQYAGIPQRYLKYLLLGAGILILIIGGWIWSLKKQVRSKTKDLKKALEDRAILMQEIHHRVKNNLAMIAGLLDLQMDTTSLEEVKDRLEDSKSRIQSMALIHDKLYQTESYQSVRLDTYIKELVEAIHKTFADRQGDVDLRFSLDPIEITVDRAVTCGLLVNELVVNAFKHAFHSNGQDILEVELNEQQDEATLVISDNGPGLPDDFGESSESLGSLLIDTFASQLEAEMDVESDNGSRFSFYFTLN